MLEKASKRRNGAIDFLRMAFCIYVAIGHFGFQNNGYLGVEFFFIISGYFMCCAANKDVLSIGRGTLKFIQKKVVRFYSNVFITFILLFICRYVIFNQSTESDYIYLFLLSIFELLLCTMTGLGVSQFVVGVAWYLSAMLICMMIIYPLIRKYNEMFYYVIAPLGFIFLLGFLYWKIGSVAIVYSEDGHTYFALVRAFAEMLGGALCYKFVEKIQSYNFTIRGRVFFTAVECLLWIYICISIYKYGLSNFDFVIILMYMVGCTISLSNITYLGIIFNRKPFFWVGELSLSFYLCHIYVDSYLKMFGNNSLWISMFFSVVVSIIIMYLSKGLNFLVSISKQYIKDFFFIKVCES